MKFSTKSTYGLRAMIRLAKEADQGSVSLSSIADKENISQKYLEKLFAKRGWLASTFSNQRRNKPE